MKEFNSTKLTPVIQKELDCSTLKAKGSHLPECP